jgi:O-antigen/teichoic acid export membrane protein
VNRIGATFRGVPRRELLLVGGAMAVACALVLAYVAARYGHPLAGDQYEYDLQGQFIADGKLWWTTTPFGDAHAGAWKMPLYPLWVGFWYWLGGDSPTLVGVAQAFLAPITVLLIWLLSRRLFGATVAIITSWVVAVFPLVWEWNGLLYSEAFAVPLTVLAILLFLGRTDPTPKLAATVGVVIGVGMLVRPSALFLFAGVLASFALALGLKRGLRLTVVSIATAALMIAPWTIRNYIEFDAFLPFSVQDGAIAGTFNAEVANDPVYPYAWRPAPAGVRDIFAPENAVDDAELAKRLRSRGLEYIEEHPFSVVEAFYWNGLSRFWDIRKPARALDDVPPEGRSKPVTQVGLAMYYVLLPLAVYGLWRMRRRRHLLIPILAMAVAASLVFTVVSGTRYRAPLNPIIGMLAVSAVVPLRRGVEDQIDVATTPSPASSQSVVPHPSTERAEGPVTDESSAGRRRVEIGPGGLRGRVARGTVINSVFMLGVNVLTLVQGLLLAGLLGAAEYGLWGLLTVTFGTLFVLARIGLNDKYIQQDHPDQRAAFEVAFTLQSMLCGLFTVIAIVAIPLFSLLYEEPRILLPGLLLAFGMPMIALQTPIWIFYRRLEFMKQRLLMSVLPVVTFVVTVSLALSGVGFWSIVIGTFTGLVASTAVAVRVSPYPLRFRYQKGIIREYATFSWPLFIASISAVLMFQIPLTLAARSLGAAAVGAITLALQISQYTRRVDTIVTDSLYPAICAVKDRGDLLFEAFSKSNRLAILWAFPVGIGAAIFADPAVPMILGNGWELAVPLVQVLGLSAAVDQIGFNWTAFARARGETKVLAVAAVVSMVAGLAVGVPLLLSIGLNGFAIGLAAAALASLAVRIAYLTNLFPRLGMVRHVAGAIWPTLSALALIGLERVILGGADSPQRLLAEVGVYVGVVALATATKERSLMRESLAYLRGSTSRPADGVV